MNRRFCSFIIWSLALLIGTTGCIRDEIESCPPLKLRLVVKDKNYFNIDMGVRLGLEERKADDLPFRDYVSTLYYILTDAATGTVVREQTLQTVTTGDREIGIAFPKDLPFGTYVFTAWGNLRSERPLGENAIASDMHLYNNEGDDIYLTSDTLVYDETRFEYLAEMERVKGKLIVQAENLPDNIDFSTKDVHNLFAFVTANFGYSRETMVHTDTLWREPNEIVTRTVLCPSTDIDNSILSVNFYDYDRNPELRAVGSTAYSWIAPDDIRIQMARNELTILRYVYVSGGSEEPDPGPDPEPDPDDPDPDPGPGPDPDPDPDPGPGPGPSPEPGNSKFRIYIRINDNWENLHSMEIE